MESCDSYRLRVKPEYSYDSVYGHRIAQYDRYIGYCNATRERDECNCDGDRSKCTFYPEVRKSAFSENAAKVHNGGELLLTKQEVERLEQLTNELLDILKSK